MNRMLAGCAAMVALPLMPAQAQNASLSEAQIELYSEIWAMAGVCGQLAHYSVRGDALADRLDADLGGLSGEQFAAVSARRDAKLEAMRTEIGQIRDMPNGFRQRELVDRHTAALITRCDRLARDPLARDYFTAR